MVFQMLNISDNDFKWITIHGDFNKRNLYTSDVQFIDIVKKIIIFF